LEQIKYNRLAGLPPEARVAKSSKLTAPICNAALRGEFPWGLRIGTFPRRQTGGWVIAATGSFDIIGAPGVGWLHKQDSEACRRSISCGRSRSSPSSRSDHELPGHHVRRRHRPDLSTPPPTSALINLPIVEAPVARPVAQPA